jgi:ATP-dependent Lon protease
MTGEITLRGRVLPIGGLKEKLIAAVRGGIKTVLIPKENERDLKEVPAKIKRSLEIIFVETMDDVIRHAVVLPDPEVLDDPVEYPVEDIYHVETPQTVVN